MAKRKKKTKENPDLLERGQKVRAGQMLSEYIRAIGQEMTEVVLDDGPSPGPPKLVSKAERMARYIWEQALPHKTDDGEVCKPNLNYIKIVLDRSEGKPGIVGTEDPGRETVPEKISRMNAERINAIAGEVLGDAE